MEPRDFEKRYDFPLDPFQREAIGHLSRERSVLVAAPTGSGKTVIAEYALERSRARGKKSFYTTPLKALSNQKFRDLSRAYPAGDVGLLTGDNSINGEAPLVVMTTEVLRNMIYEKSPLLDNLGVVVLDEVHYMHDPFRGAVWEEIVILLPAAVKLVALSATVSNASEIGGWMDSLRGDVRVVVSRERPVKLHNQYFVGRALVPLFSKNLFRVIDEQLELMKMPAPRGERRGRRGGPELAPRRANVLRELAKRDMLPAIYFLFSRAGCNDSVSRWLEEGGGLTSPEEREEVAGYLEEKVVSLEQADLDCLDYHGFRAGLEAGVAAHHAGALPLFKEAVEELFARGLVKVVFATETLSLGINMPARTVVIESLSKWTGDEHRPLTPGEYKQLTGRAGRRGIDEVGYSVVLYQRFFSPDHVRSLVTKEPNPVVSSFQVTYNMAVNLLAEHDMAEAQRLINLSFAQYEADRLVVGLEARLESLEADLQRDLGESRCDDGGSAVSYRDTEKKLARLSRKLATLSKERRRREAREALSRLRPGDVFLYGNRESPKVVAVVRKQRGRREEGQMLVVDSLGRYRKLSGRSLTHPPRVVGKVDVEKVTSPTRKVRRSVGVKMESLGMEQKGEADAPSLTPEEEEIAAAVSVLKGELAGHPCHSCRHRQRCVEAARRAERSERRIIETRKERDSGHDVVSKRLADVVGILSDFGFMEGEGLTPKGEVLRRIYNECDLLLVWALDTGMTSRLDPQELVAFASWFIYESREGETSREQWSREDEEHLEGMLGDVLEELFGVEARLKEAEAGRGLDLMGSLDTGFSEAAYLWGGGAQLEDMLSRFPERSVGDMVRNMKQIIDLLRQVEDVSPDPVLARNLRAAMGLVDRGVVGYSSLESIIEHETPRDD